MLARHILQADSATMLAVCNGSGLRAITAAVQLRQCKTGSCLNRGRSRRDVSIVAMAGQKLISTDKAPAAVGAYSQAVKAGQTLYVSGQLGLVPGEKRLADGGVEAQTDQALKNMGEILKEAGLSYDDVVKTTILLADISDFSVVNTVYAKYFDGGLPARACYAVKSLPLGGAVEIEAIAFSG